MNTTQLMYVLNRAWAKLGQQPGTLLPAIISNAGALAEMQNGIYYLNEAFKKCWDYFQWPESIVLEPRYFAPIFDYATAYANGAQVFDQNTQKYWYCIISVDELTTPGDTPTSAPSSWAVLPSYTGVFPPPPGPILSTMFPLDSWNRPAVYRPDITGLGAGANSLETVATAAAATVVGTVLELVFNGQVQYVQLVSAGAADNSGYVQVEPSDFDPVTNLVMWIVLPNAGQGETRSINQVIDVFNRDPRLYNYHRSTPYFIADGAVNVGSGPFIYPYVWVEIKQRAPTFVLTPWSSETTYAVGNLVYYSGDTYSALLGGTNVTPGADHPLTWELVPFPARFEDYVVAKTVQTWKERFGLKEQDLQIARSLADEAWEQMEQNLTLNEQQANSQPRRISSGRRYYGRGTYGY